ACPTNVKVVSEWFPAHERAFATSIFDWGARLGPALALPIVGLIITAFGWRASFVVTGMLGLIWAAAWLALYRAPRAHPWASPAEVAYIEASRVPLETRYAASAPPPGELAPHPYRAPAKIAEPARLGFWGLFAYRTVWGMMLGFYCLSFVIYFFITWF